MCIDTQISFRQFHYQLAFIGHRRCMLSAASHVHDLRRSPKSNEVRNEMKVETFTFRVFGMRIIGSDLGYEYEYTTVVDMSDTSFSKFTWTGRSKNSFLSLRIPH
jgi:hypothetical protein